MVVGSPKKRASITTFLVRIRIQFSGCLHCAQAHDPGTYDQPYEFRPERFLGNHGLPDPASIAFGWGKRACPGRYLAEDALFLFAAMTLTCFTISPVGKGKEGIPARQYSDGLPAYEFKCVARCITGSYRNASRDALEKEAALLPAPLRLESALLHRLARYLTLPPSHGIIPLIKDAIARPPKRSHRASPLHYVELLPAVSWPTDVPAQGVRLAKRPTNLPTEVTADPSVELGVVYGARRKRGGVVTEPCARGPPPPPGGRRVPVTTSPVTSADTLLLGMERIKPVYLPPWADPLPVTTLIPPRETAVSVLDELLADQSFADSTWFTDGSLLAGAAAGAAVLVVNGSPVERILLPLGDGQVAEGEMEGILRATERALIRGADHILVVSDSQAGLRGLLSTDARAGQHRAIQYDELLRAAVDLQPALRVTNVWTPAHIGTAGNELADDAAKAATLLPAPATLPVSLTSCKRHINSMMLQRWCGMWKKSSLGHGLREIDDSPPCLILRSPYTSSVARADISLLGQLRTNFSALNAHRFRCRLIPSAACDFCGASKETRAHFLLHCPAWSRFRAPLQDASYSAGVLGAVNMRTLLNHPKLLKPVIEFIHKTGRFN
ncbi:hypothetical protein R3P38DRAFT_3215771 [Favolaschia claudopus]|uniref:RNase H type-1 domain-containing protein n=1 Tax=Favolaschia claudopus TaxID=2862362 RepID=A0AAW0A7Y6_9AGAR